MNTGNDNPLTTLLDRMAGHGARKFYAKMLAANDNSKNQVYLGGGFGSLNIVPHSSIETDTSELAGSVRDRAKAKVDFYWLEADGLISAPNAQLILYPKYPEVRMSGFLKGSKTTHKTLMTSRDEGRVLILGICSDQRVIGAVLSRDTAEAKTLNEKLCLLPTDGVFVDLDTFAPNQRNSRIILLQELKRIHEMDWIPSQKLAPDGEKAPYSAMNAGGYTLEAELGITPNGYAEPDFEGWEIKQYGVDNFEKYRPKSPVTLMTPEPTGGLYQNEGLRRFLELFGYDDRKGIPDRRNFGGKYTIGGSFHHLTGLKMIFDGYDLETGRITNLDGSIMLVDRDDTIAASWGFKSIIEHWNRKHAKTAYVPSMSKTSPKSFRYGAKIETCEGTDVLLFFSGFAEGAIYYDPAIKMTDFSGLSPKQKKRSQFRVNHKHLPTLYKKVETIDLNETDSL